jgi:mono/diheme cytochrome c family protein
MNRVQICAVLPAALVLTACGTDRVPRSDAGYFTGADAGDGPTIPPPGVGACAPARTSEPLAARVQVTSLEAEAVSSRTLFVRDIFLQLSAHCGGCHVGVSQGNFRTSESSFPADVDKIITAIRAEKAPLMPPVALGGKPFSERSKGDPIYDLVVDVLEPWKAANKPNPWITATEREAGEGANRYLLPPDIGAGLTNLGNCIPDKGLYASKADKMDELDSRFAQVTKLTELPERLDETDMVALDSETLARNGVVSFAPAYPLWSDSAGKMRYVRVPRGTSITFDKAKQQFNVPENSRFYKTFLKKVIDRDGNESFRKIETRLIVSRADKQLPDGTAEVRSLYGSYLWNDDETEAVLLRDPMRNGAPFTDKVLTYIVNEPKAREITETTKVNVAYALEQAPGVLRHYAVPGSTRCVECHMGSPSASFVLGFTPLQINRLPVDSHGIIEPTGEDELTQLQRFIDIGLVTGISSPSEVLPLTDSQGTRKPRTPEELIAQGYMLGNCSGCHNPRGFPTIKNKELRDLLNFLPGPDGGIFGFPLERYSPRIKRGANTDEPIPYITPSLRDVPRPYEAYTVSTSLRTAKWDWEESAGAGGSRIQKPVNFMDAPWRSLIYRNVDAPFTYSDDLAIFPRMPRNTPSFDCRAPRIMASWMVSLPARRKKPMTSEHAVPPSYPMEPDLSDTSPQPYEEVRPGDPDFEEAKRAGAFRVRSYQNGRRYSYCPSTDDIFDPRVKGDVQVPVDEKVYDPATKKVLLDLDSVPNHPHWVPTDLTEAAVDWVPRRPDWKDVLAPDKPENRKISAVQRQDAVYLSVLEALDHTRITDEFRNLTRTEIPYGTWQKKPECERRLASYPTVGELRNGANPPGWLDRGKTKPPTDARVYKSSPGAAVFNAICINCHGPRADSRGLQAETLAEMTGGDARVANLRDGLLGSSLTARNIDRVFGPLAGTYPRSGPGERTMVTAEDWAGRYIAWMALGGTEKRIPQAILNNVGASEVLGVRRFMREAGVSSPNMLQSAQQICRNSIPHSPVASAPIDMFSFFRGPFDWAGETSLVDSNGDADMWIKLCSFGNRPIVRVVREGGNWSNMPPPALTSLQLRGHDSYFWADGLPQGADVMDDNGEVRKWDAAARKTSFLFCVARPTDPAAAELATKFLASNPVRGRAAMPFCPSPLIDAVDDEGNPKWMLKVKRDPLAPDLVQSFTDIDTWAARGAINAGLAVFLYLQDIKAGKTPTPRYDQCQELPDVPAGAQ